MSLSTLTRDKLREIVDEQAAEGLDIRPDVCTDYTQGRHVPDRLGFDVPGSALHCSLARGHDRAHSMVVAGHVVTWWRWGSGRLQIRARKASP